VVGWWVRALVGTAVAVRTGVGVGFTVVVDVATGLVVVAVVVGFTVVGFMVVGLAVVVAVFATTLVAFVAAVVLGAVIDGNCVA
jgi:hypothetical protein